MRKSRSSMKFTLIVVVGLLIILAMYSSREHYGGGIRSYIMNDAGVKSDGVVRNAQFAPGGEPTGGYKLPSTYSEAVSRPPPSSGAPTPHNTPHHGTPHHGKPHHRVHPKPAPSGVPKSRGTTGNRAMPLSSQDEAPGKGMPTSLFRA
jgi:hypothetical protein